MQPKDIQDSKIIGGTAPTNSGSPSRPVRASETRTGKDNLRVMPRRFNGEGTDPTDPNGNSPGASPAAHRLEAKRGLVLYQFVETNGDTRVVARRHGVQEIDVKRTIARMLRPVVGKILREAA